MSDVTIIGGGIIGLLTARELALSGASVCLLERGETGRESSWAGGGILSPVYPWRQSEAITALSLCSQTVYPKLAEDVMQSSGIDPQWRKSGLLITDISDRAEMEYWCRLHSVDTLDVESFALSEWGTDLRLAFNNAAFFPKVAQIRNPRLMKALRVDLRNRGVTIVEHCEVLRLVEREKKISHLLTSGEKYASDIYVVTAGAWTKALCQDLLPDLEMEPVKGQIILFKGEPAILNTIILDHNHYLIPRKDGRILAGSTLERVGFDKSTSKSARESLKDFALSRIPRLKAYQIENHWAGLRPATPSGNPVISQHPEIDNLYINSGHFRNGIVLAPASARLLVDSMLGRAPIVSEKPYSLK